MLQAGVVFKSLKVRNSLGHLTIPHCPMGWEGYILELDGQRKHPLLSDPLLPLTRIL